MYRLIIVDDEQIVLDGLKFLIEDTMDDVQVVATASSGREAILACEEHHPDIVFMDIKMPGINGIEAIETLQKRMNHIKFVIISAYEQFEYAKQAVELGVSDYILKPVNPDKVVDVLKRVMEEIRQDREARNREIENKEKLEKILPVLEHGFIYSLLMNTDYREELHKYQGLFDANNEKAYAMILEFGEGKHPQLSNKIGTGFRGQSFYPKVQSTIKYKCRAIVGPLIVNRMTVLVFSDDNGGEYEQRVQALELAESIYESVSKQIDVNVYIGIGSPYPLEKSKNSLEEAMYSLNRMTDEHIVHVNDIVVKSEEEEYYTHIDIKEDENHIIKLLESGQKDQLISELKLFFNRINKKYQGDIDSIRNTVIELMVMVLSCSFRNNLQADIVGYSTYINELHDIHHFVELSNWSIRKVSYIADEIGSRKSNHISKVVVKAKEYIDEHLMEEVSLVDISKYVSVSPQYFSKIFKDEIGVTFVEYVRKERIEIAKTLLREKQYSVKEVCYRIGYNDPNYFSRLFKKLVGVSPTEYK